MHFVVNGTIACVAALVAIGAVQTQPQVALLTPVSFKSNGLSPMGTDSADLILIKDGVERKLGTTYWTLARDSEDGREVIRLTVASGGRYINTVDARNQAALSSILQTGRDSFAVRFTGTTARGGVAWLGRPWRVIDTTLATSPFLTVAVEHLLGTFPLADGFSTDLDLYAPTSGVVRNRLTVRGSEVLPYRGEQRAVWKVDLTETADTTRVRTFWLDKQTGKMLRRENPAPGGARGVQVTR